MLASAAVSGQATAVRAGSRAGGAVGAGEQEDDAVTSAALNCWGGPGGPGGRGCGVPAMPATKAVRCCGADLGEQREMGLQQESSARAQDGLASQHRTNIAANGCTVQAP
jgi:hypothetical protein